MGPCFRMLSQGRRERMQLSNGCPVIASASEAIHLCRKESMDCFVAYAPRNDVALIPHTPSSSRREAPEAFLLSSAPLEGVGNAGCPLHPRPRVHLVVVERTRVTTSTPESPGIPARNGFNGLLRALPGDRALLPPSSADMFLSKPGWADLNSANLTPASGRQDHTTSPSAATSLVRTLGDRSQAETCPATSSRAKRCRVHRIPPRVS